MRFWLVLLLWPLGLFGSDAIEGADAFDRKTVLNPEGFFTVVIASNQTIQDRSREVLRELRVFHGRSDFRQRVVVDLRGSMAHWAKGYTKRRIQREMEKTSEALKPFYVANGNPDGDPKEDISVLPDFKGKICMALGWEKTGSELRVNLYGRNGDLLETWKNLEDPQELYGELVELLGTPRVSPDGKRVIR